MEMNHEKNRRNEPIVQKKDSIGVDNMNIETIFDKYFNGNKNPFTTKVYGYDSKKLGGEWHIVFEKSENKVLSENITYGVSALIFGEECKLIAQPLLSKLFNTKSEVEEYIKSIDIQKLNEVGITGEVKLLSPSESKVLFGMMI